MTSLSDILKRLNKPYLHYGVFVRKSIGFVELCKILVLLEYHSIELDTLRDCNDVYNADKGKYLLLNH